MQKPIKLLLTLISLGSIGIGSAAASYASVIPARTVHKSEVKSTRHLARANAKVHPQHHHHRHHHVAMRHLKRHG